MNTNLWSKKFPRTTPIVLTELFEELSDASAQMETGGQQPQVYVKGKVKTYGCVEWKSGTENWCTKKCDINPKWYNPCTWAMPGCLECVKEDWYEKTVCGLWGEPFIDPNQQYYKDPDCTIPKNYNFG